MFNGKQYDFHLQTSDVKELPPSLVRPGRAEVILGEVETLNDK